MSHSNITLSASHDIVQCSIQDLKPGRIGELFSQGKRAAVLKGDSRIHWLWENLVELNGLGNARNGEAIFPWESSIQDVARNHESGNIYTGDMLRFTPGALGHIARKVILFKDADNQLSTVPSKFLTQRGELLLNRNVIETVWEVVQDVLKSSLPEHSDLRSYAVKIDILKYPSCLEELDSMLMLLGDSSGSWTRRGMQLDRMKAVAVSFFDKKYIRDLFAFGTLIPGLGFLLCAINKFLLRYSKKRTSFDKMLVGEPHVDGPNILTCLISDRDTLSTEVYGEGRWIELPLGTNTLAFFPSKQIRQHSTSLPTVHRILMDKNNSCNEVNKPNITVNFSVIPWPQNK